ncbi:MAG TPA: hypothetical protein VKZ41_07850, partial [Gemmatimonadales bacterium]|nr:hypothetical protein [Gemmatimonadales bacterium]
MHTLAAMSALLLAPACASTPEQTVEPPAAVVRSEWQFTREAVQRLALDGRYAEADSTLRSFERRAAIDESIAPGDLAEARYHRMLLRVDPSNPATTPDSALAAIDEYLAAGSAQARYQEALVLRRLSGELQRTLNKPPPAPIILTDTALLRQRSDEIARLRD